ncbi:U3 small nucleolar RNA-associated protein 4 homolog [Aplysia californica]|uniref:U3 small nucleolar RNA-associated protein 4 homolog n=1 Tax=Aplysia californica TaxID=6500 RepID=A0ABM0JUH0_APLCA|nr:U3 small nucleolar RNA-associated protein 4 homolog [Aplysia californica]
MGEQVKLQVHHVRFFNCQPQTINCICHDSTSQRVAVSRSDGSVEILGTQDNWIQELVLPGSSDASVEALAWAQGRLFAAGLGGNIVELDMVTQSAKETVSSNAGPVWCLTTNAAQDQLAAGTEDGCVVLFDVSGELQYLRGFGKQEGRILSIAWYETEVESMIVTGGVNNIRQWSVKSGQPLSRMTFGRKFQKDTIVWCVAVTQDFTIISGDSRGIVTFWNGKESTQIKTFHCHKADVLGLCLSEDEQTVYSSGVDAALYQFSLYLADPASERKRWVQQLLHSRHTHDVRALAYRDGCVASGGVDAVLQVAKLKGKRSVWDVDPFPATGLVNVASDKNLVQLQYPTYVEVWRLGAANQPEEEARGILPLTKKPVRLLQLKARSDRRVLCSAVSPAALVAFSDTKGVRLFQLNLKNDDSSVPDVSLTRVPCGLLEPARLMTFTSSGQALVAVSTSGSLQVVDVSTGRVKHTVKSVSASPIHRLSASPNGSHFATATTDHGIHVYSAATGQHVCSCPVQKSQVSALAFSPHSPSLVIAYSNHSIYEFDVDQREYTPWSRANSSLFQQNWLRPMSSVRQITFSPHRPDLVVFHTDAILCVLDKSKTVDKGTSSTPKMENIRKCCKYKYLLSAQYLSDGMLVAVEYTPPAVEENLPPSLKQKRFGIS